jgi:methionine biosynthesis protein MetW
MRFDLALIQNWIEPGARVLDLGCGDGTLLEALRDHKNVDGLGVEIEADDITRCIARGINVVEQDLNASLGNFKTGSFDVVVMTLALQALRYPHRVLDEMLRIGREGIVTFPNFGHWRCRWYLGSRGRMPVSEFLPYTWYDTPNIHFCTVDDFEALCREKNIRILDRAVVGADHSNQGVLARLWPNLFGVTAVYHISR